MGLFTNPLGYAGYPPGATAPATLVNSTVRAATLTEANAGVRTDIYLSPATAEAATALDFASPPVLGFGSTTPRPVHATTLDSTLNTALVTSAAATAFALANVAPTGARTSAFYGGNAAVNDTITWFGGNPSLNTQSFTMFGGIPTGGTQSVGFFTGNASGGAQSFSVLTGTRAGTLNLASGAAAHVVTLGSSTSTIGFFGATPVVKQLGTTDLRVALINLGLYTTGGATPLDLNGGTLTALQTIVTAPTVAGASPVVNNSRAGIASFSDAIGNGAYGVLTITNSTITSSSVINITPSCATGTCALQVTLMVPGSGTVAVTLFNAGASSTAGNNILLNYHVLN